MLFYSLLGIRGEVGQMIVTSSDKQLLVVEKRKLLLPPNYTRYFSWGYLDHSARIASVEGDKVSNEHIPIEGIVLHFKLF